MHLIKPSPKPVIFVPPALKVIRRPEETPDYQPSHVIWHTQAGRYPNCATGILEMHQPKGWKSSYHFYVHDATPITNPGPRGSLAKEFDPGLWANPDGAIESITPIDVMGISASTRRGHLRSWSICFQGFGDSTALTRKQLISGIALTRWLLGVMAERDDNAALNSAYWRLIGHNEAIARWGGNMKTCPGLANPPYWLRLLLAADMGVLCDLDPEEVEAHG